MKKIMKVKCLKCNKIVDTTLIDKDKGAYLNKENKIVCFNHL